LFVGALSLEDYRVGCTAWQRHQMVSKKSAGREYKPRGMINETDILNDKSPPIHPSGALRIDIQIIVPWLILNEMILNQSRTLFRSTHTILNKS